MVYPSVYILISFIRKKIVDIFSTVFENLTIEICRNDSTPDKYLISTVYIPPKPFVEDLMTFIGDFSSFLRDVHRRVDITRHIYVET